MKLYIIFPKQYFTAAQMKKLYGNSIVFIEGNAVDLEMIPGLFAEDPYILVADPTYLKDGWGAFPMERIGKMKGLRSLCLTTTSYSWVNGKKLADLGITLTNTPGKSTEAVAEFNIYMMYTLLRKLPLIVKNGWQMDYDRFVNGEVRGLMAGIVGLGAIGTRVAQLCRGLGMHVNYWNRTPKHVPYERNNLSALFRQSDVLFNTLATPPELHGFIDKKLISGMKNSAIIVSTSDTHVLDKTYILRRTAAGKLGGFAFESTGQKLKDFNGNVMVFPEQAYFTRGTLLNTARIVTDTILSIGKGKPIHKVN